MGLLESDFICELIHRSFDGGLGFFGGVWTEFVSRREAGELDTLFFF